MSSAILAPGSGRPAGGVAARVAIAGVVVAIALWAVAVLQTDLTGMTDLGLVSVLPLSGFAALAILNVSFMAVLVNRPLHPQLLLLFAVVLIVMLYGFPAMVEAAPRFNIGWRHVGITEVLIRNGSIDPHIDAYFSWAGFFALSALMTEVSGVPTTLDLIGWAPVAFNLLYLPALLLIMRAATRDQRVVWLAVWIFFLTNWIGQDYYAPQAFAYLLYLLIIGVVLTWFGRHPDPIWPLPKGLFAPSERVVSPDLRPVQRAALMGVIVFLFAVMVMSHQLTPFATLGVVLALVLVRRISPSGLPLVMGVLLASYLSFMTVSYLQGHLRDLVERIGSVDTAVAANLTDRVRGSQEHLAVLAVRGGTTVLLWGLAGIGALRRIAAGDRDLTWLLLAAAPFGLFFLQNYGGEILLRIYLFSLPFMALLAANAVLGMRSRSGMAAGVTVAVVVIVLNAGFLVSRYGNERMDMATAAEQAGMQELYSIAPEDSLLVAAAQNVFWRFQDYELYHTRIMTDETLALDVPAIIDEMAGSRNGHAYLVMTRAQRASLELQYGMTSRQWETLISRLENSRRLVEVYANEDVHIFTLGDVEVTG
jgi:hypothetical protein